MSTQPALTKSCENSQRSHKAAELELATSPKKRIAQAMQYWRNLPVSATDEKAAAAAAWDKIAAHCAETVYIIAEAELIWKMSPEHGHARKVALARWITLATNLSQIKTILRLTEEDGELRNIALLKYVAATDNLRELQAIEPLIIAGTSSEEALQQKLQKLI